MKKLNNIQKYFLISLLLFIICVGTAVISSFLFGGDQIIPTYLAIFVGLCFSNMIIASGFFTYDIAKHI